MKIVVINGSSKGKAGNTNIMASAFLKGAGGAGAETVNIFLSEKNINHCRGCHACWSRGPGQCVINDDMGEILLKVGGANIIAFATPVYFANISGMLKVFMDRMTMIGSPHSQKSIRKETEGSNTVNPQAPKLMIMASCGFPDRGEFDVVSLWIKKVAQKMHMELVGEIYAAQGKYLASPPGELLTGVTDYLLVLEKAGAEVAESMKISEMTNEELISNNRKISSDSFSEM